MKKLMMASAVVSMMAAVVFGEPSVAITKVKLADARDGTVEYGYTVSGDFEGRNYDLIVEISADDGTKAAVLTIRDVTADTVNTNVNVKALLGGVYPGVSLFAKLREQPVGVQLWAGGPYFAEFNVGAEKPEEYGNLYAFNDDKAKEAAESFGKGWRLPTEEEFEALTNNCNHAWAEQNGVKGRRFAGKGDYSSSSIFLPAAGYTADNGDWRYAGDRGFYWSSTPAKILYNCFIYAEINDLGFGLAAGAGNEGRSVRAVRDAAK